MNRRTYLDFHVLQSVPPSCINRDDTGSPKSAAYGGVRRVRVSSQAWKRATRLAFEELLPVQDLGIRTKRVVELVTSQLQQVDDVESRERLAAAVVAATGLKLVKARNSDRQTSEFLVLVSQQQASSLAALAHQALADAQDDVEVAVKALGERDSKSAAKRILGQGNSIDLALFGRMVANDTDLNVDASCQVAHALSVHAAENEFDYFTAVDDLKGIGDDPDAAADSGAGMIGTVEFSSATLYRYATINIEALAENLGDQAMLHRAVSAFAQAFVRSMPTGKINTFANNTLPAGVLVSLRDDQPVSYVGAFERPIVSDQGYVLPAARALREWAEATGECYGTAPLKSWVVGIGEVGELLGSLGERTSFLELPEGLTTALADRVPESV